MGCTEKQGQVSRIRAAAAERNSGCRAVAAEGGCAHDRGGGGVVGGELDVRSRSQKKQRSLTRIHKMETKGDIDARTWKRKTLDVQDDVEEGRNSSSGWQVQCGRPQLCEPRHQSTVRHCGGRPHEWQNETCCRLRFRRGWQRCRGTSGR